VAGEGVEVAIERGHVERHARGGLAAIKQKLRTYVVRERGGAGGIQNGAQDIGNMGESDEFVALGQNRFGCVKIDAPVGGERAHIDVRADPFCQHLPGNDVAVVLKHGEQDAVARADIGLTPSVGDQIDRLGRAAHEDDFVRLVRERAKRANLNINAICADFSYIETIEEKFDAVLFFECFHHAADHLRILRALNRVINDDGIAVFGAEPILDAFPVPWGLRMDGESLWAIRKHGWLELGFQETYFRNTLRQLGWGVSKHECHDTPWGTVFVARRS